MGFKSYGVLMVVLSLFLCVSSVMGVSFASSVCDPVLIDQENVVTNEGTFGYKALHCGENNVLIYFTQTQKNLAGTLRGTIDIQSNGHVVTIETNYLEIPGWFPAEPNQPMVEEEFSSLTAVQYYWKLKNGEYPEITS